MIWLTYSNTDGTNFSQMNFYAEGIHNSKFYSMNRISGSGNDWYTLPTSNTLQLNSVTDTGFTYKMYSSNTDRYTFWVALK